MIARPSKTKSEGPIATARCIYCGKPADSDEHVIPRFLGEFSQFPHLKNRICKDCNNEFGKLERQLARSGPEALMRVTLGIEGRPEHRKCETFTRPSSGADPIEVTFRDDSSGATFLTQPKQGGVVELRSTIHAVDNSGREADVLFDDDIASGQQLIERLKKKGLKDSVRISWTVREADKPRVESLVSTMTEGCTPGSWIHVDTPAVLPKLDVKYHVTEKYYRAIAKIAFHYMLTVCPEATGSEECFQDLRRYIRYGNTRRRIVSPRNGILRITTKNTVRNHWSHMIVVAKERGILTVSMQFFIGLNNATAPIWEVRLNDVPIQPDIAIPKMGHIFAYVPAPDNSGYYCITQLIQLVYLSESASL